MVTLVRNPHFRLWSDAAQPDGFPDRIVERFGYTGQSAVSAVESGKADVTADGPDQTWTPALASMLRTRFSSHLHHAPLAAAAVLWLNMRLPPFNDIRARQALNYAVDRNHLIELAGGPDVAQVGCQLLPPNTAGYRRYCPYTVGPSPAGTYNGPDLAKARRLVAASRTLGEPVTVWFYDVPIGKVNGQYIVSVLRRLGYKATLRLLPHKGSTWRSGPAGGRRRRSRGLPVGQQLLAADVLVPVVRPHPPAAELQPLRVVQPPHRRRNGPGPRAADE